MTSTPEDWRNFLTTLSIGHTYNSRDLRTVPTQDLMAVLHPMLTDPELMFYLEYEDTDLANTILSIAKNYDDAVPRQSSAYIVSNPSSALDVGQEYQNETKGSYADSTSAINYILNRAQEAVDVWVRLGTNGSMRSGTIDWANGTWEPSRVWADTVSDLPVFQSKVDDLKRKLAKVDKLYLPQWPGGVEHYYIGQYYNLSEAEYSLGKALANLTKVYNEYVFMGGAYGTVFEGQILSTLEADPDNQDLLTTLKNHQFTPDALYTIDKERNSYLEAVGHVKNVILTYLQRLEDMVNQGTVERKHLSVVVRFFPGSAFISEPLPQINTTRLSENSFVQTATPAMNISVSLQGNLAFDTPDTQWRGLYAEIFKAIVAKGNPKCTARIGRHIVPNCYLLNMPDLTNSHSTTPTFNFSLVSTEWDSAQLTPVNYVG